MIDNLLNGLYQDSLSDDKCKIYWENEDKSKKYECYRVNSKRDILDIPILEVMNATCYAIEQQISMPVEDLKRLTSQILGFSRKGTNLELATENAILILIEKNILKNADGIISFQN